MAERTDEQKAKDLERFRKRWADPKSRAKLKEYARRYYYKKRQEAQQLAKKAGAGRDYFEHVQKLAKSGTAQAEKAFGDVFFFGIGIDPNPNKAVWWWKKSAKQDDADAQYALALAYDYGEGVKHDDFKATEYYKKAAKQEHADAQYALARAYHAGKGIGKDKKIAMKFYAKAALQEHSDAQYHLAMILLDDEREYERAYRLLLLLIDKEHIMANWIFCKTEWRDYFSPSQKRRNEEFLRSEKIMDDGSLRQNNETELTTANEVSDEKNSTESGFFLYAKAKIPTLPLTAKKKTSISPFTAKAVFDRVWQSVVYITTNDGSGSGVIVQPNIVLTNAHVTKGATSIKVFKALDKRGKENHYFSANDLIPWNSLDFCILNVSGLWGLPATIRRADTLQIGEQVYALGAPEGAKLSFSAGIISQLRGDNDDYDLLVQTDAAISCGSSGGGLFDVAGNLIGLTTSSLEENNSQNLNFAVRADLIFKAFGE